MAKRFQTYFELLGQWASAGELAADINANEITARSWRRRGIPPKYWHGLIAAAAKRRFKGFSLEALAAMYADPDARKMPAKEKPKAKQRAAA